MVVTYSKRESMKMIWNIFNLKNKDFITLSMQLSKSENVIIKRNTVKISFIGKKGQLNECYITDPSLKRIIRYLYKYNHDLKHFFSFVNFLYVNLYMYVLLELARNSHKCNCPMSTVNECLKRKKELKVNNETLIWSSLLSLPRPGTIIAFLVVLSLWSTTTWRRPPEQCLIWTPNFGTLFWTHKTRIFGYVSGYLDERQYKTPFFWNLDSPESNHFWN